MLISPEIILSYSGLSGESLTIGDKLTHLGGMLEERGFS